ncbi:hypothetical protein [Marinospirillum sp.]|uniref:hypothetical protein n=1 Tax=Marinospirillum sp. TaxID=2183934 RepID=UPI003A890B9F
MKLKKIMERVAQFLDADSQTQYKELCSVRKILKELKQKERKLREKNSAKLSEEEATELQIKLDVIYAQRKKGLEKVKLLREELKKTKKK